MKTTASYWRYWGKASPATADSAAWHLLPLHSLDVAAVMHCLLEQQTEWLAVLAARWNWQPRALAEHLVFFAALHDIGKFSRSFQRLCPHDSPGLVSCEKARPYTQRHDTLGFLLWLDCLSRTLPENLLPAPRDKLWGEWIRVVCGHHGQPPKEGSSSKLHADDYFLVDDQTAATAFCQDVVALLLPEGLHAPEGISREHSKTVSWPLAGLMVLADWLGSSQAFFRYHSEPLPLDDYWFNHALPAARQAIAHNGLGACVVAPYCGADRLTDFIDYLHTPTPLQHYAATVTLDPGPQLFLLEDVTGAGKTEAALILAHRLMAAGHGKGLYFALPTMATSNQMYRRVGAIYRKLYQPQSAPSIVLAHSARQLVDDFTRTLQQPDHGYGPQEGSASMHCNAWLADGNKKALLAHVGVGSIDQALLAVLPARHQSLRLAGLRDKVLVIDEVHSFDPYVKTLLCQLLRAHAAQGGSAILLSATVPHTVKTGLLNAFRAGLGLAAEYVELDPHYPLTTRLAAQVTLATPCETRAEVRRTVAVQLFDNKAAVLDLIAEEAAAGRCVCWIRNTVDDARQGFAALQARLPAENLHLFHSRFAIGHRLDIENRVLDLFGKHATAAMRRGQVLIGTQVLEQSLDFDADIMISDLAPIDLLIQRAGRLQRHARHADGQPADDGIERRPAPRLCVFGPPPDPEPKADWYGKVFAGAQYVYPDFAKSWLTQQALLAAGCIISPGVPGQTGAVRQLVEAVYGDDAEARVPAALQQASARCLGEAMSQADIARFNSLELGKGYCEGSSHFWDEEANIPTRLGAETRTVYLAEAGDTPESGLRPLYRDADPLRQWSMSAIRLPSHQLQALSADWQQRFAAALAQLHSEQPWMSEFDLVLPLQPDEQAGQWIGHGCDADGRPVTVRYGLEQGGVLR
ncbi:CRISPR-associated helicase/endonuclease Cas3 [Microvirgula curvata]